MPNLPNPEKLPASPAQEPSVSGTLVRIWRVVRATFGSLRSALLRRLFPGTNKQPAPDISHEKQPTPVTGPSAPNLRATAPELEHRPRYIVEPSELTRLMEAAHQATPLGTPGLTPPPRPARPQQRPGARQLEEVRQRESEAVSHGLAESLQAAHAQQASARPLSAASFATFGVSKRDSTGSVGSLESFEGNPQDLLPPGVAVLAPRRGPGGADSASTTTKPASVPQRRTESGRNVSRSGSADDSPSPDGSSKPPRPPRGRR